MELRVELRVELRLALGAALSAMTQSMYDQDWTFRVARRRGTAQRSLLLPGQVRVAPPTHTTHHPATLWRESGGVLDENVPH